MGGPPPWGGSPQPYGFPPPQKKSHGGMIAAVVGGVVVVLLLVVVVIAVAAKSGGGDPKKTSGEAASKTGEALGRTPGLSYNGTLGSGQATFSVTKAGSARGTYTKNGGQVTRVDIGGTTYMKAGSSFWTSEGQSSAAAGKADGKWVKAPDSVVDLKLSDLSPAKLSQILQQAGNDPTAEKTSINGTETIKMAAGGTTYYISAGEPRRLVRIEGDAGSDQYAFNVTPLAASGMGTVFAALRNDVKDLADAYDPGISVLPMGKIGFGSCGASGCTVRSTVTPSAAGDASRTVRVSMHARFWGSGSTVSTCSGSSTTTPSHQTTISCRTSGGAWSSWYHAQSGRFTIHSNATFEATVNTSSDVSNLLTKLTQEQQGG